MQNVLVTGATGFIGFEVVRRLAAEGLRPRALVRRPSRAALLTGLDIDLRYGDLHAPETLRRAVDGVDTVIHLAARATFERAHVLWPTIVDGTASLAAAAAEAGVASFVYGSSLLVYPSLDDEIDADTRPDPKLGYGVAKIAAENRVLTAAERSGMQPAVVRLPHVYGARDLLLGMARRGLVVAPGLTDRLYSHLYVGDAARLLIEAGRRRWAGVRPVADEAPASWAEYFDTVRALYPRLRVVSVPTPVARVGAAAAEQVVRLLGAPTLVSEGTVVGWSLRHVVARGVLWDELDLSPRWPTIAHGVPTALDEEVRFRWRHSVSDFRSW